MFVTDEPLRLVPRTERVVIGDTLLLRLGSRGMKIDDFGDLERQLLRHFIAGGTVGALNAELSVEFGATGTKRADVLIRALMDRQLLQVDPVDTALEPADLARFSRLLDLFSEVETDKVSRYDVLARLRRARVTLVGLGGLGCWVLYQLLCMGVGKLRLVDGDNVEMSNLNRSILYTEDDVGRRKVDAAAEVVQRFAPRTEVELFPRYIGSPGDLADVVQDADLVINCADQPHWLIRQWVAEACRDAEVPDLQAGSGRVGPLHLPGKTSCMMCHYAEESRGRPEVATAVVTDGGLSGRSTGSLSSMAGLMASVIAYETFRFLSQIAAPLLLDKVWALDPLTITADHRPLAPASDCPVCGDGARLTTEGG